MNKGEIGKLGENIAKNELLKKGYKIIAINFKGKSFELDIICRDPDQTLVFVEVKAMVYRASQNNFLAPEDNLSIKKLKNIKKGCGIFLAKHPNFESNERGWRIDLLTVALECNIRGEWNAVLRHYKNIY
jgi:putative endonuclease